MAKWGEGDPRWIVEERPDATNVNNWHWTEKNATHWSKERLAQLFEQFVIDNTTLCCSIDKLESSGEATVNNRKGKLIFFYDWQLNLQWSGQLQSKPKQTHKGKIIIPNLSEENDLNEVEITISIEESNDDSEALKAFMYNIGRERIRQQLGLYIKELKEEYSKNLILPKKGEEVAAAAEPQKQTTPSQAASFKANTAHAQAASNAAAVGCKLDVKELKQSITFQCSPNDLYNTLTRQELLSAFTRSPAKVDAMRGGEFQLYNGNVQGKFEELVPEQCIKQTWRLKSWPSGHYSHVEITLKENKDGTVLKLRQTGIPASEYEAMPLNWKRYYWNSIKQTFGYGSLMLN